MQAPAAAGRTEYGVRIQGSAFILYPEASPVSPRDDAFGLVERVVSEVFPDAVPAPYVMMAGTDSRHFTTLCPRVYRFAPLRMTKQQRQSIHGVDEHVLVEAFLDGVRWYRRLLEELPG